ncbi:flagellar hook-associated protein FlgK [Lysinibacillus sp. 2017]|uniref:flagellar hook-associated protein FlgK n=1 Tax=unclassified Lysinibacillus TaxID=2636778 RepID=UPI000D5292DF|nr:MULTISPECIES: flagellar hook-associated protein FlgK [unclassified Lysinibacillus]AWE06382.1 flagellar hook-associated protein FlgK [Lysinibacillus sp. 2017]TGN33388.1 flagellar hook-associated protein FlgK [Lysinibacillus sp. S2017]
MRSTFMGLEASKRGLYTQQSALYTTGHNISNANTDGYTRQRVNMETTPGYPGSGLNSPTTAGHIGTGVEAQSVQRIRDQFVDRQFRQETNKLGYWEATTRTISQMEDVMSEPSEFGVNQAFTDFWKAMEDINTNPKDTAARQVLISRGQSLAESFNYMDTQLKLIQGNIGNEIDVTTQKANNILKQIAELNKQIISVEPNGYMPNDLYDARDVLLDQLNDIMPVSVSYEKSGGNALAIAEGSMTVTYKAYPDGEEFTLVQGREYATINAMDNKGGPVDGDVDETDTNSYYSFAGLAISAIGYPPTATVDVSVQYANMEPSKGSLNGLIDSYGYTEGTNTKGIYPEMLSQLDNLAKEFITVFNEQHSKGYDIGDPSTQGTAFFSGDSARSFGVLITEPKKVAASSATGEEGNNKNMLELAKLQSAVQKELQGGTFQSFYKSLIGDLAVKGQQAVTLEYNSGTLRLQIEKNRASHNSVSLDEEMTNMITFQQAYNANARMITVIDETLDKIINGMGRVGL